QALPMHLERRAGLVDFAVGTAHQRLQPGAHGRFGGEGVQARQVGGAALVEVVQALDPGQFEAAAGIGLQFRQHGLQFVPPGALGSHEAAQVHDHSACLRLTSRYWEVTWALMRAGSTTDILTPWRRRAISSWRSRLESICPARPAYRVSRSAGGSPVK